MSHSNTPDETEEEITDLGVCCACGTTDGVRNIVMLHKRAPKPGTGWGCVVCGLSSDGAVCVICDDCLDLQREAKFVCFGYPADRVLFPIDELSDEPFEHDMTKHGDEEE